MPTETKTLAREDLCRSVPFTLTRDGESDGDGLTFEGYGAVFNTPTRIDSWEGTFDEQIARGAFRKTIRERTPVLQFDHGRHAIVGSIPIGSIRELREDERGLFVSARLASNWLIEPVREAIANGSVNGMSFRFETVKDDWFDAQGKRINDPDELMRLLWDAGERGPLRRTLREVKVPELGPVVFPAYPDTTASVRSRQLARVLATDEHLVRRMRANLAASRPMQLPEEELSAEEIGQVARALLFPERREESLTSSSVPDVSTVDSEQNVSAESADSVTDSTEDSACQDAAVMIGTSELGGSPDDSARSDVEAPETGEPLPEHSDTSSEDEPPLGHSEPGADATPIEAARSTTPPGPTFLQMAQAEEQQLARQHRAARFRASLADASAKSERYANV
jgi:hypothetical protein